MFFNLDRCVGHITDSAVKQITDAFTKRLQNTNVTRIQWIALYYLKTKGQISQRELSNLMGVKDSSAGRLLDRLERDGYISRERNLVDRRITFIDLTDEGDSKISKLMEIGIDFNNDLIKNIDPKEIIIYEKVLNQMIKNITED